MRFRSRLFLALVVAALVPLALLAWGVRREMTVRLEREAAADADAAASAVLGALAAEERRIRPRLEAAAAELAADNGFRLAVVAGDSTERRRLIDWAGGAMRAAGLDLLRIHDADGRILSSGHFRGEHGRTEPLLPDRLLGPGRSGFALARVRGPSAPLVALVAAEPLRVAGRDFTVVGGIALDTARLRVALPGMAVGGRAVQVAALPFLDAVASHADTARFVAERDPAGLAGLRRRLDLWVAAALGVTLLVSLLLAWWLAARIARPITELAEKTALVDLDRLDQRFASDRDDEIGALAELLDAMTVRLRRSTASLREAERRAATGDLARQVNHDIRNGLAPIRHVLRHLTQVAEREPAALAAVYGERRGTLESSVEYLDGLAREYARLSPALDRTTSSAGAVLQAAAAAVHAPGVEVRLDLADDAPAVRADAIVLRRIVDNLVANAVDALAGRGTLTLSAGAAGAADAPATRIVVADTGPGMTRDALDRAFQDFQTTKPGGTGLGLSVVRRLVGDLGGSLRVETSPGAGTRFIIELPAGHPIGPDAASPRDRGPRP